MKAQRPLERCDRRSQCHSVTLQKPELPCSLSPSLGEGKHPPSRFVTFQARLRFCGTLLSGPSECFVFSIGNCAIEHTNSHVQNVFDHILLINKHFPSLLPLPSGLLYKSTSNTTNWQIPYVEPLNTTANAWNSPFVHKVSPYVLSK